MERMLRYSLEHDRVIRLMLLREGKLSQVNARILAYDERQVRLVTSRSPREQVVARDEILSADFRKEDDGQL